VLIWRDLGGQFVEPSAELAKQLVLSVELGLDRLGQRRCSSLEALAQLLGHPVRAQFSRGGLKLGGLRALAVG
jgi:hypothetical protein